MSPNQLSSPELNQPRRIAFQTNQLDRFALPAHSVLIGVISAFLATIVLCLRNYWVFSVPIHEDGDYAANSILTNQAVHFTLLVGNYSREGFNHPGPAYLYIQAVGQDIFYAFLHLVPAQYNGQLIAIFALNSAMFVLATMIIFRHVHSGSIAVMTISVVLVLTGTSLHWASSWMPLLYAAPFLLATIAGVSVAVGALQDLPAFTFAVCLLIHGHVAFIGIMGAYVLIVTIGWIATQRHVRPYRIQLSEAKRFVRLSIGIVVLFAIPIILNLVLHWPGQWVLYWQYAHGNSQLHPHTIAQVAAFVEQFWPGGHVVRIFVLVAGLAATVLALFDPDRVRRTFVLALLIAIGLLSLEFAIYVFKGVDHVTSAYAYIGYFYYVLPPLLPALLLVEVGWRLQSFGPRLKDWRLVHAISASLILLALGGLVLSLLQGSFYSSYRGDPALPRMAAAIKSDPARGDGAANISLEAPGAPTADWGDVDGLLMAASRDGYQSCVANPSWKFMMTSQYICSTVQSRTRWRIDVQTTQCSIPSSARQIFRNRAIEIYTTQSRIADPCPLTTSITDLKNGDVLKGSRFLNAAAFGYFGVTKVDFEVTGEGLRNSIVSKGSPWKLGWIGGWRTTTVPNGFYTLESVAYDATGNVGHSRSVSVEVEN